MMLVPPMHTLAHATIRNFRSCESVTLDLAPYTPFVGYNNAGKSNIHILREQTISSL